jgi:hypothetical protein
MVSVSSPTAASQLSTPISEKPPSSFFAGSEVSAAVSSPRSTSLPNSSMQYCFDSDHAKASEHLETHRRTGGLFLYTDATMQENNMNWLSPTGNYLMASPEDVVVSEWSPASSVGTPAQPSLSLSSTDHVDLLVIRSTPSIHSTTPCLCDPVALGIISELHNIQKSDSQLDTALILARRGFSIVSSCLTCSVCHASTSGSLFFACILIVQQIFTCYAALRVQGLKMLNSSPLGINPKGQHPRIGVGDFDVEDGEGCFGILNAIVKLEIERSKGVLGGLEEWAEMSGDGGQKTAKLLLRTLKEELGC